MKSSVRFWVGLTALAVLLVPWSGPGKTVSAEGPVRQEGAVPADASITAPYLNRVGAWPYGLARDVALDEGRNLAFLSSGGAVLVLDVTDPLSPTLLADTIHTLGSVEDLDYDAATQRLYIAAGEGGFENWDLQNPAAPQRLSLTELMYGGVEIPVLSVAVKGNWAYVAADWGGDALG